MCRPKVKYSRSLRTIFFMIIIGVVVVILPDKNRAEDNSTPANANYTSNGASSKEVSSEICNMEKQQNGQQAIVSSGVVGGLPLVPIGPPATSKPSSEGTVSAGPNGREIGGVSGSSTSTTLPSILTNGESDGSNASTNSSSSTSATSRNSQSSAAGASGRGASVKIPTQSPAGVLNSSKLKNNLANFTGASLQDPGSNLDPTQTAGPNPTNQANSNGSSKPARSSSGTTSKSNKPKAQGGDLFEN